MKKKILFVIDSLHCAGAEKSLVTLLNLLDYEQYEVDLQLFAYGGAFEKLLPSGVNLLPPLEYTKFSNLSWKQSIQSFKWKMIFSRLSYSIKIRVKEVKHSTKARFFWESVQRVIGTNEKDYDIAIAYAQGIPTFYVADKIRAKHKYAWVNVSYHLDSKDKAFQREYYRIYNNIIGVSASAKDIFQDMYPEFTAKMKVIYDINDPLFINRLSKIGDTFSDKFRGVRLLTIGRLSPEKGYEYALEACKILKDKGICFRWYVLGVGPLEEEIRLKSREYGLEENFILLGVTDNPYTYIKDCDIYVQTSKFEGFGLAIAEARMLNKPVVTTRFDAVFNQMVHEKNGLVVDMNGEAVAQGILRLVNDSHLREDIISYLRSERKGNVEELEKFYQLIN